MILGIDFLAKHKTVMTCGIPTTVKFVQTEETSKHAKSINAISMHKAQETLEDLKFEFADVFDKGIGCVNHYKHKVTVKSDKPFKKKPYPIQDRHMDKVRRYNKEIEKQGVIKKAATEYINPLVVVIKKNGDIRLCLDAREINDRMENDHAQPPTLDEVFRRIGNKKYYTTLDISQAFWQIPLEQQSKKYMGFMFDGQSYVFERMPFGIKTAGGSFTRAMKQAIGTKAMEYTIVSTIF